MGNAIVRKRYVHVASFSRRYATCRSPNPHAGVWKGKRGAITDWLTTDRDGRFSAIVAVGSRCRNELQGERRALQEIEVTSPDDFEVTGLAADAKD